MNKKQIVLIVAGAVLSLLAGCIVLSVYPFYTDRDLISDPTLAGRWVKSGSTNEFWQFTPAREKAFNLAAVDPNSTNVFEAHVFQLGKYRFLDLLTTNREDFQLPMHLISRLEQNETNLSLIFMDFGWLAGYLETNPAAVGHIIVPQEAGNTNGGNMVYLRASTRDLQKFLLKHAADTNAFSSESTVELKRVSP